MQFFLSVLERSNLVYFNLLGISHAGHIVDVLLLVVGEDEASVAVRGEACDKMILVIESS